MENKKVLLRLTNLKQYFPLKGGRFVKANDGISIEIHEGETLGIVGESCCGKSTLGRTMLQFYKQTDGRTVYYGRMLEDVAPMYFKKTIRTMVKMRKRYQDLQAKADELQKRYDAMKEDSTEKYKLADELILAKRTANNAFLDIVSIVGGFMKLDDPSEPMQLFLALFDQFATIRDLKADLANAELNLRDAEYYIKENIKNPNKAATFKSKKAKAEATIKELNAKIDAEKKKEQDIRNKLDAIRANYKDDEEFQKLEAQRDEGIDLARLKYQEMRHLRTDLQFIFQDPYSSLNPRMTVGQIVGEGMLAHGYFKRNDAQMQEAVLKTMDDCGLAPYFLHRYPHQFSGGQRQRIGIARALSVYPKFVVCDEAVSALDVSIQSQIINLLQDLKEKQNLTYMFITHDLSVVKYISDRIGVMYLGTMVELAPSQAMFSNPRHPYTEALLNAIPTTDKRRDLVILEGDIPSPVNPPKGCKFHTRCAYCTEICQHQTPELIEVEEGHFVACHHMLGENKNN